MSAITVESSNIQGRWGQITADGDSAVTADPFDVETVHGTPNEAIAKFATRSKADWNGERADAERAAAARERRENEVAMMQLRGDPVPTSADVFRRALAISEAQERIEAAAAQRERAERAMILAGDAAAPESAEREAELEAQSSRSTRALGRATEAIARLRRRESVAEYDQNYVTRHISIR